MSPTPTCVSASPSTYDAKHSIKAEGNKKATLILGADDFPFPIPLVNNKTGWEFDTGAGRIEILYRRIGRNELDAIQTSSRLCRCPERICRQGSRRGRGRLRATHRHRRPARRTGCSGVTTRPEPARRVGGAGIGRRIQGRQRQADALSRLLFSNFEGQGSDAPGGALNYVVKGKMIGGFALIA